MGFQSWTNLNSLSRVDTHQHSQYLNNNATLLSTGAAGGATVRCVAVVVAGFEVTRAPEPVTDPWDEFVGLLVSCLLTVPLYVVRPAVPIEDLKTKKIK